MGVLDSKAVLITGGTGSFGQWAVARFLDEGARKVIIYSRDEYKQSVMRSRFQSESRLEFRLGDVRDRGRLMESCEGVDHIIHAAAMKQVPSCEENPMEAVLTNVIGASNVIDAARENMVEKAVNLSADKAVYSTSVYGATKFLSERLFVKAGRNGHTRFMNLRYSNVLDSRGSVFEVFSNKLVRGEAVSVFDPQMTRFFLTQDQVVDLCLFALENGVGGETYIRLAPPVNILKLAETMARLIGKGSVEVLQEHARLGEKLDAILLSQMETKLACRWKDILIINNLGLPLPLEGLTTVDHQDYTVDDFEPMSDEDLEVLVREALER